MNDENHLTALPKRDLMRSPNSIDVNKKDLKRLSKSELIKMLLMQKKVRNHKELLDNDPFKDEVAQRDPAKHIKPRDPITGRFVRINREVPKSPKQPTLPRLSDAKGRFISRQQSEPVEEKEHITDVPPSKIKELNRALKGHAKSYGIELQDDLKPLNHFTKTKVLVESCLEDLLKTMKGFKFIETLEVTFKQRTTTKLDSINKITEWIYKTAYLNGKAKSITEANDIEHELSMSRQEILNTIDKWISEGSGWVIDRIDGHYINVTTYKPLNGSSYVKLPSELQNSGKGLIHIKNDDDECFRWCHIRFLNPQKTNPQRINRVEKQMINELHYVGIAFPLTQKQYNKIEMQNNIRINVFGYEKRQPFPIHISKEEFENQMNLLLITKDEKSTTSS